MLNANEDVVKKLDRLLGDETTTDDIEIPDGKVIGMTYRKKKKKNKLGPDTVVHETSVVGGGYVDGTATIVGSGQGRVIGKRDGEIEVLRRKPKPLRFNKLLGAYLPANIETEFEEGEEE